jgi:outer membrane protein OmpA-like peptidoglycan-associated protein
MKKILIIGLLFLITIKLLAQPKKMIVCYPFNGNAHDISGRENHAFMTGVTFANDRFGIPNSACFFNKNAFISLPAEHLIFNNYAYSIWVKPTVLPKRGALFSIISIGNVGGDQNLSLSDAYYGCKENTGWAVGSYNARGKVDAINSLNLPELNRWYHLVINRGHTYLELYVNGVLIKKIPIPHTQASFGNIGVVGYLGKRSHFVEDFGDEQEFQGFLDDFCIFDEALSQTQITRLYTNGFTIPLNKTPVRDEKKVFTVSGKVIDAKTREPLCTKIFFQSEKMTGSVVSNASNGKYKIDLQKGLDYEFSVLQAGFLPLCGSIKRKNNNNQDVTRNISLEPTKIDDTVMFKNVLFEPSSPELLKESYYELDRLLLTLQLNPMMEILIEGHTDVIGLPEENLILSGERVKGVKKYFVEKGISESRIQTKAFGGNEPLVKSGTDAQRKVNRRVAFVILKK